MPHFSSDFLQSLSERGYIHQCSDETQLDKAASEGVITAYVGFDCTAPSLHIGNLLGIMMLRRLQQAGHKPIVLIGGGTTRVGDPSGKDETRQMLTDEKIEDNIRGIKQVFDKFLTFGDGPTDAMIVNNRDWLDGLGYIEFLRDYGKHFTINRMMTFDSVKLRLDREQPLTFLEFNYMILQAYDFVELSKKHGCTLQMGGSDQWGNIINGIDLGRRTGTDQLYALTTALLTTSSGAKMGKSVNGAVWLNAEMLSPYDYWQYWRNTEDADVGKFLRLFTELPLDEVAKLEALEGAQLNEAKKILATEATAMVHGRAEAEKSAATAQETFENGGTSADLPTVEVPQADIDAGLDLLGAFITAGLSKSKAEMRRHIKGNAVSVNGVKISDATMKLGENDVKDGVIKLSIGKKRHVLVKGV